MSIDYDKSSDDWFDKDGNLDASYTPEEQNEVARRVFGDVQIPKEFEQVMGLFSDYVFLRDLGDKVAYFHEQGTMLSHEDALPIIERLTEFYRRTTPQDIEVLNYKPPKQVSPAAPKAKKKYPGYVYLLKSPSGYYKIGRAKNPSDRIATFHVKLPFEVELIALVQTEDMHGLEKELHEHFAEKRVNGEWFELDSDDVALIKGLAVQDE